MPQIEISCPRGARTTGTREIVNAILETCAQIKGLGLTEPDQFTIDLREDDRVHGKDVIVIFQGLFRSRERSTPVLHVAMGAVGSALIPLFDAEHCTGVQCFIDHGDRETYARTPVKKE